MFGFGFGGNPFNPYARLASFGPAPYQGQSPYGMSGLGGMGGVRGFLPSGDMGGYRGFLPFGGMGGFQGYNPYAQFAMPYQPQPYQAPNMGQVRAGASMGPGGSMGGAQPSQGGATSFSAPGTGAGYWDQNMMNQAGAPGMGAVRPMGPYQAPNMGYVR